ncbi:MAG: MarR family transcriptional regulator [Leptolyngbyaceae cyanobacterium CSU_1_3]|nr:MarR family transcriptional regulator [Leptolyngbyaceae cyanobacterium CSU_1_3]
MIANTQRSSDSVGAPIPKSRQNWQEILAPYTLGYRVKLLSQLMLRRFQEQLDPLGLTPFHWVVLCCLWTEDGLATSNIGDKLQQVGGTLTGVLDRMAERGLIRRERDSHDRRVWRIWLTPAGRELNDVLPPIATVILAEVMRDISAADQAKFSQWVNQAIENLS